MLSTVLTGNSNWASKYCLLLFGQSDDCITQPSSQALDLPETQTGGWQKRELMGYMMIKLQVAAEQSEQVMVQVKGLLKRR